MHPFTKESVSYHRNAPPPEDVLPENIGIYGYEGGFYGLGEYLSGSGIIGQVNDEKLLRESFLKNGGTYLRLGKYVLVSIEPENRERQLPR
jgi:hypothetical protein